MLWWLKKLFRDPVSIGSVAPSSRFLARLMVRDLKPGMRVLELGPGQGAITRFILARIQKPQDLTLLEFDPDMAATCRTKFPSCELLQGDVEDILSRDPRHFDAIISSIPFVMMGYEKRTRCFQLIRDHLEPGGPFVMFQYSPTTIGELKKIFSRTRIDFTLLNLPPAFVYRCRK